ncbi:MAG: hypothetical protein HYU66_08845, partial [Armatimonadetes bacterium]|nr:hypothetical protein [Armatimonadota bacterium]
SPLYLLGKLFDGPWLAQRLMRLAAPGFGLLTLAAWWGALRRLFRERTGTALFATAMIALWPHALMANSLVSNDNGANLAGAVTALFLVSRPGGPWSRRDAVLGGLILGLAALMKGRSWSVAGGTAAASPSTDRSTTSPGATAASRAG